MPVVLMYSLGIFLLANLAGYWIDYRAERRGKMLRGRWSWNMKDHILILNAPGTHPEAFLRRLVEEIRHWRGLADVPIQVVTEAFPDGLPEPQRDLGVVHQHGDPDDPEVLAAADVTRAAHILLLTTSETDPRADSITLAIRGPQFGVGVTTPGRNGLGFELLLPGKSARRCKPCPSRAGARRPRLRQQAGEQHPVRGAPERSATQDWRADSGPRPRIGATCELDRRPTHNRRPASRSDVYLSPLAHRRTGPTVHVAVVP